MEAVEGSVENVERVAAAVEGMDAAYYLVHAMCSDEDFSATDRKAALAFAEGARGIGQVIYLGGILPATTPQEHSEHLRSRAEVGEILREKLPTTELRAGPIIGSGSASFEMVRYLTERLPAMVAPRWIRNQVQPIAVRDILAYLEAVLGREDSLGIIDVGSDPLSFKEMMLGYAGVRGLPRLILPVPVLAPGLAARWVGLVTPIPNCLAIPLVRGIVTPVVGDTRRARELFPEIRPIPYRTAVEFAVEKIREHNVPTRWSDALGPIQPFRFEDREGMVREIRTRLVDAPSEAVFRAFCSLGGERGWLVWNWAWRLRGWMDKLVGGPQCGIILGEAGLLDGMRRNPFYRAFRVGKLTLSALEATLRLFLDADSLPERHRVMSLLALPVERIGERAEALAGGSRARCGAWLSAETQAGESQVGGGSLAGHALPTVVVRVQSGRIAAGELARRLRLEEPPVFARVQEDSVRLDPRTMLPDEDEVVVEALARIGTEMATDESGRCEGT